MEEGGGAEYYFENLQVWDLYDIQKIKLILDINLLCSPPPFLPTIQSFVDSKLERTTLPWEYGIQVHWPLLKYHSYQHHMGLQTGF